MEAGYTKKKITFKSKEQKNWMLVVEMDYMCETAIK